MADYELRILDWDTSSADEVLDVSEANGYHIRSLLIPEIVRRRDVVTSPDMPGEVERQSVEDAAVLEVQVSCRGTDAADAWTLYDDLKAAVNGSTRRFRVETVIFGETKTWQANRALAWRLDVDKARMRLHHRDVSFLLPVYPIPVEDQ